MQNTGAMTQLHEELAHYTALPYKDLVARISEPPLSMQMICGDERYFAEFKVLWHDRPTGELCISGSISRRRLARPGAVYGEPHHHPNGRGQSPAGCVGTYRFDTPGQPRRTQRE